MSTENYEHIGSLLYQKWRCLREDVDSREKAMLGNFIKQYVNIPLFLVGFGDDQIHELIVQDDQFEYFTLPYKSLLLDFPKSDYMGSIWQPMMYVSQNEGDEIFVDILQDNFVDPQFKKEQIAEWSREYTAEDVERLLCLGAVTSTYSFLFLTEKIQGEWKIHLRTSKKYISGCSDEKWELQNNVIQREEFVACRGLNDCSTPTDLCKKTQILYQRYANLVTAALSYISLPHLYIVRESAGLTPREHRHRDNPKIPFFLKKPRHLVLDYSQVKQITARASGNSGITPIMPHRRRGHWRYLKAECFKVKKKVLVKPADINAGLTWKSGKRIYEVMR